MKRKKGTGAAALILATVLLAAGCSEKNEVVSQEGAEEDVTTLTFFGNKNEPENVTVIEEIISSFMKDNPDIRVSYESLKGTEYYDALAKRMASGKGDDVFMVNHDILLDLEKKGQVAELSGLDTIDEYTDEMLGQMKDGEDIYWVPTTVSMFGLYCNLDLLKEHGQEVPENLGEWKEICGYFKGQGITPIIANNDISLKTLAIGEGFYDTYQEKRQEEVFEQLNSGGEKLSQYLESGFSLVKEFIDKEYVDAEKALNTEKTSDDLKEFVKGESPFMLTGAWAAGRVEGMDPGFKFEVAPLPVLEEGALLVMNPDVRLSVNADSANIDAAMKFVEYFTKGENIERLADQQSSFSPLKGGNPSSVQEIQPLIPCYKSGQTVIGTDSLLELPIWNLTAEVSQKLLSGETLEEAMEWMDQQAEKERETP